MTQHFTQRNAEEFIKEPLGEYVAEAIVQRLDRVTPEEVHATVLQTLEVIHGLVQNMRVTMNGETNPFLLVTRLNVPL